MLNDKVVCFSWEYATFLECVDLDSSPCMWLLTCSGVCPEPTPSAFSSGFSTLLKMGSLVNAAATLALPGFFRIASLALAVSESTQVFCFI